MPTLYNRISTICKLIGISIFVFLHQAAAQTLSVTPSVTNTDVENAVNNNLFGGCITASNIAFTGFPNAVGSFTGGTPSVGFPTGIVLTTGLSNYALGPNNSVNRTSNNFELGDSDIDFYVFGDSTISVTNDATSIEFDFVPLSDTVSFTYVWASEEYPEYVNSGYNDAFAFFLSGGPTNMPPTNIALVPGQVIPVTINNVNQLLNSQYFNNNTGGMLLQYDGYTVPLDAVAQVVPCQSYHIKLVVADVGDRNYDSAVFLKFGSFSSGSGVTVSSNVTSTNTTSINEGCNDGVFTFSRDPAGDLTQAQLVTYTISGTATSGTDYTALPSTVTIPAGQSSVTINLATTGDALAEGNETIVITLDASGCSCNSVPPAATITIVNSNGGSATISGATTVCSGQSATLTASGGAGATYSWNPGGATSSSIVVSPASTTTYTVAVTGGCGVSNLSAIVSVLSSSATFTASANQCLQNNSFTFTNTGATGAGLTFGWDFGDGTTSTLENATHSYATASIFTVTHTISSPGGCSASSTQTVTVTNNPTIGVTTTNSQCASATGSATATVSGAVGAVTYSWNTTPVQTTATASNIVGGAYTVTVTSAGGCTTSASGTVTSISSIQGAITATTQANCGGGANGTATAQGSNGIAPYSYFWNTFPAQFTQTAVGLAAGTYTATITDASGCVTTADATVGQSTVLTVNTTGTNITCNGGTNGTASAFPQGGTLPYTVSWSNNGSLATISSLTAGTYTVTINDNGGCSGTSSVTLTEPTAITATVSTTPISCVGVNDGTATATVLGGQTPYSYLWGTGEITQTISAQSGGSVSVTATDAQGCTATASGNIATSAALTATISSITDATCFGQNNGAATVSVSGGTTPYSYSWSNGQTVASANNLVASHYPVIVTDAHGCKDTVVAFVGSPPQLIAAIATFSDVTCNGTNNGTAESQASGGVSPYTYSWNNGPTTSGVANLSPGTYTVTITDSVGCQASTNVSITNSPGISITTTTVDATCFGLANGSATASGLNGQPPFTYSWTGNLNGSAVTNLAAGNYTVTATDFNTCIGSTTITINEPPGLNVAITATTNSTCPGTPDGSTTALASNGTSPYNYQWSNGQNLAIATALDTGTYTVTATDFKGCTTTATSVITAPNAVSGVISVLNNVSCFGGTNGQLQVAPSGGNGTYTYMWDNGQTTATATGLAVGVHSVDVSDSNGCQSTVSGNITQPGAIVLSFSANQSVSCNGLSDGSVTANPSGGSLPYTYLWGNNQSTPIANGLAAGMVSVTITDNNGCTKTDSVAIAEPTLLTVSSININQVLCFNDSNGSEGITVGGGITPYTFLWSNGDIHQVADSLSAGNYSITVTDNIGCTATNNFQITQPTQLQLTLTGTLAAQCFNSHSGEAYVAASGGIAPYNFVWNNGETGDSAFALIPGIQIATVVDSNGCSTQLNVTISSPPAIMIDFVTLSNPLCASDSSGSITIAVSGGISPYHASWDNGDTNLINDTLRAGNYSVLITDAAGCPALADTFLNDPPPMYTDVFFTTNVSCFGAADGVAEVHLKGGTLPYTFLWSNGQTDSVITSLDTGVYDVTITDANGCFVLGGTTVTQPPVLNPTVIGQDDPTCFGQANGSAVAFVLGGTSPYTYLLNGTPNPSTILDNLSVGNYVLTVTDANQCTDTAQFSISQPSQVFTTITGTDSICPGTQLQLNVTGSGGSGVYTYNWPSLFLTDSIVFVSPQNTTNYAAIATDFSGCVANPDTFNIIVVQPPVVTFTQNLDIQCGYPATVQFTNTSAATSSNWTFSNGQTSAINAPVITFDSLGTFTITLIGANSFGCSDTATSTFSINPTPTANFTGSDTACGFATVHFTNLSQNASTYNWVFGDGHTSSNQNPQNTFITAGTFDVQLVAVNGNCTDTFTLDNTVLIHPLPGAEYTHTGGTANDSGIVNFTDNSEFATAWEWIFADNTASSNLQNPSHVFETFGEYSVKLIATSAFGCVDSVSHTVKIELFKNLAVPNALIINGEGESAVFLPKASGLLEYSCLIYDKWGNILWQSQKLLNGSPAEGWDGRYNGSVVQDGAYIWRIEARFADDTRWIGKKYDKGDFNQTGSVTVLR